MAVPMPIQGTASRVSECVTLGQVYSALANDKRLYPWRGDSEIAHVCPSSGECKHNDADVWVDVMSAMNVVLQFRLITCFKVYKRMEQTCGGWLMQQAVRTRSDFYTCPGARHPMLRTAQVVVILCWCDSQTPSANRLRVLCAREGVGWYIKDVASVQIVLSFLLCVVCFVLCDVFTLALCTYRTGK
jgi:hypothetical protein